MSSPDFATVAPRGSSTPLTEVDALVARLAARKHDWTKVGTAARAEDVLQHGERLVVDAEEEKAR